MRSYSAYTCAAPAQRGCTDCLVAGTVGGRLRWLDLEKGCPLADVYCHPISRWQVVTLSAELCSLHDAASFWVTT